MSRLFLSLSLTLVVFLWGVGGSLSPPTLPLQLSIFTWFRFLSLFYYYYYYFPETVVNDYAPSPFISNSVAVVNYRRVVAF